MSLSSGLLMLMAAAVASVSVGCQQERTGTNDQNSPADVLATSNLLEYKYSELHPLPEFTLTERSGNSFGTEDLEGKVWIASFFFSRCKFECSTQNRTIRDEVHEKLLGTDVQIVSFTVDPEKDTPQVLSDYSKEFVIAEDKWKFVTGPLPEMQRIGSECFKVVVDRLTHTKRLLLVDKWGRFRDSFEWKEADDLRRLVKKAKILDRESEPPAADDIIRTRAIPHDVFVSDSNTPSQEGSDHNSVPESDKNSQILKSTDDWKNRDWLDSFTLTDSDGQPFRSVDMQGKVWVANFFFSSCTGTCPRLLGQIKDLRQKLGDRDVTFVSITNDPKTDTPEVLKEFSSKYGADDRWRFLTGDEQLLMRRVGSEFFKVDAGQGDRHTEKLVVVDKWGKIRGFFKYNNEDQINQMRILLDDLLAETQPPKASS